MSWLQPSPGLLRWCTQANRLSTCSYRACSDCVNMCGHLHFAQAARQTAPTDEEMAAAQAETLNSFVFNFASTSSQLQRRLVYALVGLPPVRFQLPASCFCPGCWLRRRCFCECMQPHTTARCCLRLAHASAHEYRHICSTFATMDRCTTAHMDKQQRRASGEQTAASLKHVTVASQELTVLAHANSHCHVCAGLLVPVQRRNRGRHAR